MQNNFDRFHSLHADERCSNFFFSNVSLLVEKTISLEERQDFKSRVRIILANCAYMDVK